MLPSVFQAFVERSPIGVMAQAVVVNLFQSDRLDTLFAHTAQRQSQRTLAFSAVVELMPSVVLGVEPSVDAADRQRRHALAVSDQAVYDKLDSLERGGAAAVVRDAPTQAEAVIDQLGRGVSRGGRAIGCGCSTATNWRPPNTVWRSCGPRGRRPGPVGRWSCLSRRPGWPPMWS